MPDQLAGLVCVECGIAVRRCHQYHPMDPPDVVECYVHVRPTDHDPVPVPWSAYLPPGEPDWTIPRPANWPWNWLDW